MTKQESQNQLCLREEYSRFSAKSMKNKMMCKHLSSTNFDIPMTKMEWILRNIIFRHTEYWRFQIQSIRSQTEMEKNYTCRKWRSWTQCNLRCHILTMVNFQSSRKRSNMRMIGIKSNKKHIRENWLKIEFAKLCYICNW